MAVSGDETRLDSLGHVEVMVVWPFWWSLDASNWKMLVDWKKKDEKKTYQGVRRSMKIVVNIPWAEVIHQSFKGSSSFYKVDH